MKETVSNMNLPWFSADEMNVRPMSAKFSTTLSQQAIAAKKCIQW
jgi:hypothetical protein